MNFIDSPEHFTSVFFIFFFIIFGIFIFIILAAIISSVRRNARDNAEPRLKSQARIVSKRMDVHSAGEGRAHTDYYITFEFEQGSRKEFEVDDYEYGMLIEGDSGLLEHQGNRYLGFERTNS